MSPEVPRDWDAATYDRVSAPQVAWAEQVLGRLALEGGETVLDAGCGSGRVTAMLADRLPRGRVIAVDAAPSMVELARETLGDRAEVLHAELTELELAEPVDAVFSNAVFHWVHDHDALFAALYAVLRPGGRLVAQCGGYGNVERFHVAAREVGAEEPYAQYLGGWQGPWNFARAEETRERLERAGFERVQTALQPWPVRPPEPVAYVRSVCLGHHIEQLPGDLRDDFVERVAERAGGADMELDYVRLNIAAERAQRASGVSFHAQTVRFEGTPTDPPEAVNAQTFPRRRSPDGVAGPSGPHPRRGLRIRPADEATIHPGVMTFTDGGQCTANFIYTGGGNTYIGQAAHCAGTGGATETNADACDYNDVALVKIDPADVDKVNPSVPGFGGPVGVGGPSATGYEGRADGWQRLEPDRLHATPGIPGDSGSGFLNDSGGAIGTLSTVAIAPLAGSNGVADLGRELDYANASGTPVSLENGTEPFTPDVVGAIAGGG